MDKKIAYFCFIFVLGVKSQFETSPVSQFCLGCICEAISECNVTSSCSGEVCGPFRITRPYWSDAGQPTLDDETGDSPNAYTNCATDIFCATRTLQGYMLRYQQDCNDDGVLNCDDFAAIHVLGGYGCGGDWPEDYRRRYEKCKAIVGSNLS